MRGVATTGLPVLCLLASLAACAAGQPSPAPPSVAKASPSQATPATSGPPATSMATLLPTPRATEPPATETPHDAGTPPEFLGLWTVTGYRVNADGSRVLYEGGGLKGTTVEFRDDRTVTTRSSVRELTEAWSLTPDGQILLEGTGVSRVVPYRVDGDTLLLGNTDGTFTEFQRAP